MYATEKTVDLFKPFKENICSAHTSFVGDKFS